LVTWVRYSKPSKQAKTISTIVLLIGPSLAVVATKLTEFWLRPENRLRFMAKLLEYVIFSLLFLFLLPDPCEQGSGFTY
jgi:hypothetical protein